VGISLDMPKGLKVIARFYYLDHITRIAESRNAKFLENDSIIGNDQLKDLDYEIDYIESQPFHIK